MKRLISIILTLTMMLSLITVVPVQASSYDENSYTLTGVQVNDIVGIAKTQVGYKEGNNSSQLDGTVSGSGNYTKYAEELSDAGYGAYNGNAWCAYFVSWCAMKAGCLKSAVSFFTGVKSCVAKSRPYKSNGLGTYHAIKKYTFTKGSVFSKDYTPANIEDYKPKKGDIMVMKTHVGLVVSDYNKMTKTFKIIDGNTSDNNVKGPRDISINSSSLVGFVTPDYTTTTMTPTHTHSYTYSNDSAHPHSEYKYCSCGSKEYTGAKKLITSCSSCYPVGNVKLTRSFEKTKGTATFYRNNVNNATNYTLKLYRNGSYYDQYTMSSKERTISGLPSGNYTATLYAKNANTGEERGNSCESFKIVDSYAVTYNANGGSNAPSSQTKIEDVALTLTSSTPSKSNYVFKGWARSRNATLTEYQPGDTYSRNAKVTLYAVWEPETYTVIFDKNGGIGNIENIDLTYGDTIRMPNGIVKDGYYLKGWAINQNSTQPDYKLGMDYKIKQDLILYAVWGESTWGGEVASSFAGGTGTEENPYQISNASELALLAKKVNSQTSKTDKEYYILTNNIDLNYENWVPIGVYDSDYQKFYGCLDGKGYTISGLYISGGDYNYYGLFGMLSGDSLGRPSVKNLTINGDIENIVKSGASSTYIGGLAGSYTEYGTKIENVNINYMDISNIRVSGYNKLRIGGIIGGGYFDANGSGASLTNCSVNNTTISFELKNSPGYIGGIIGGGTNVGCRLINCVVNDENGIFGKVKVDESSELCIGGISGNCTSISNCYVNSGRFMNKIDVEGYVYVGGITGIGDVENSSVNFTNKEPVFYENEYIPYSMYICAGGGQVGGITSQGNVKNSKYNGCSLLLKTKREENITPAHGMVAGISPNATEIENVVCNIDGIIHVNSQDGFVDAGGITCFPRLDYATDIKSIKKSMVTADKIYAENYSLLYGTRTIAGDVTTDRYSSNIEIDKVYTNDDLILEATCLKTQNSVFLSLNNAILKSTTKLKTKAFQKNLLDLNEYQSMAELSIDNSAVWVLKDGEFPEYYYNCLNDISISNDIENGSVTIDKTQAVDGEIVTVTATPIDGYVLNKVYVDGIEQDGTTFVVDGNDEVYVTFAEEIPVFDVSIAANENVSASLVNADAPMLMSVRLMSNEADSSITANDGEEIQVNAVANSDYTVDSIYVNGEEVAGNSFILTSDSVITMDVTSISTDVIATTNDAEDIGSYFAVVSGSVSGEEENVVKYIRYWSAEDEETVYVTEVESGSGDYTTELMDLEPETTYYYQMTEFGEIKSFTTSAEPVDEHTGDEDGGYDESDETESQPITSTTYKTLTSTYKFSIECSQALTTEFLAIACYDNTGKLLALKQVECDGDTSYTGSVPIDANIDYAKIFVWSSASNLKPLAGVEIVDITN